AVISATALSFGARPRRFFASRPSFAMRFHLLSVLPGAFRPASRATEGGNRTPLKRSGENTPNGLLGPRQEGATFARHLCRRPMKPADPAVLGHLGLRYGGVEPSPNPVSSRRRETLAGGPSQRTRAAQYC